MTPERTVAIQKTWAASKAYAMERFLAGEKFVQAILKMRAFGVAFTPDGVLQTSARLDTVLFEFERWRPPVKNHPTLWRVMAEGLVLDEGRL